MSRHSKKSRGHRQRRKRPVAAIARETLDVTVDRLGAQGDGLAQADLMARTQNLYIPGTLAGEQVRVETRAKRGDGILCELLEVLTSSDDRTQPGCPYYVQCGGCALQHMNISAYADWKRDRVVQALCQRGFEDPPVLDTVLIGEGTRRRVTFTASQRGKRLVFGFNARSSHNLVEIDACPLLVPELNDLIAPMSDAFAAFLKDGTKARVHVTACENGADVLIECSQDLDLSAREAIATFIQSTGAIRVGWKQEGLTPEPVVQEVTPLVYLSGVPVELPQGGFLQASVEGEHAIRDSVLAGVGSDSKRIADLFCGLGSFTIPLAAQAIVEAYDLTEGPVRALERAAGRANLGGRIVASVRDLGRQPLDVKELSKFDAVVFDPPRAGAADQVQYLADADVARVVGVSCNPATFARDARILVDGGFKLLSVQPIDQFTYSAHVELVAHFAR